MRVVVLFVFISTVFAGNCPTGWGEGRTKCFKLVDKKRLKLQLAGKRCRRLGGRIFTPRSVSEIGEVVQLVRRNGLFRKLSWNREAIWIGYKLAQPDGTTFPPRIAILGDPDNKVGSGEAFESRWIEPTKIAIENSKLNRRSFIQSKGGKWQLVNPKVPQSLASAICELSKQIVHERLTRSQANPEICWQPSSTIYDFTNYTGTLSVTNGGYECAHWNDNSTHLHNYFQTETHNHCRSETESAQPWCYTTDSETKWDYCPVPRCYQPKTQFDIDQAQCGFRPEFDNTHSCTAPRIIGGHDAESGEFPFQVRLRFKMPMRTKANDVTDHKCGAIVISSCWLLTSAHCVQMPSFLYGGPQKWLRADAGNRYYTQEYDMLK